MMKTSTKIWKYSFDFQAKLHFSYLEIILNTKPKEFKNIEAQRKLGVFIEKFL